MTPEARRRNLVNTYSKKGRARKAFSVYTDQARINASPPATYKSIPQEEDSSVQSPSKPRSNIEIIVSKLRSRPHSSSEECIPSRQKQVGPSAEFRQKKPKQPLQDKTTRAQVISVGDYDALASSWISAPLKAARRLLNDNKENAGYTPLRTKAEDVSHLLKDEHEDELALPAGRYAVCYGEDGRSAVSRLVPAEDDEMSDSPVAMSTPGRRSFSWSPGQGSLESIVEEDVGGVQEVGRKKVVKKKGRVDLRAETKEVKKNKSKGKGKLKVRKSEVSLTEALGLESD